MKILNEHLRIDENVQKTFGDRLARYQNGFYSLFMLGACYQKVKPVYYTLTTCLPFVPIFVSKKWILKYKGYFQYLYTPDSWYQC